MFLTTQCRNWEVTIAHACTPSALSQWRVYQRQSLSVTGCLWQVVWSSLMITSQWSLKMIDFNVVSLKGQINKGPCYRCHLNPNVSYISWKEQVDLLAFNTHTRAHTDTQLLVTALGYHERCGWGTWDQMLHGKQKSITVCVSVCFCILLRKSKLYVGLLCWCFYTSCCAPYSQSFILFFIFYLSF